MRTWLARLEVSDPVCHPAGTPALYRGGMERKKPAATPQPPQAEYTPLRYRDESDDEADIRYSLTSLGEVAVARSGGTGRGRRFRGFGPCAA